MGCVAAAVWGSRVCDQPVRLLLSAADICSAPQQALPLLVPYLGSLKP